MLVSSSWVVVSSTTVDPTAQKLLTSAFSVTIFGFLCPKTDVKTTQRQERVCKIETVSSNLRLTVCIFRLEPLKFQEFQQRAVRMAENPKILRYTTTRVFRHSRPDVFRVFEFSGAPPRHTDKTPLECPKTEYLGNSII